MVDNPEQVSEWERFFYAELSKAGIRTLLQCGVDQYVLDLAIVNRDKKPDIEVDVRCIVVIGQESYVVGPNAQSKIKRSWLECHALLGL